MRYQAQRLYAMPMGTDTAHGIWDFDNADYIRLEGYVWSTWDAAHAEATAARLNAGKGLE